MPPNRSSSNAGVEQAREALGRRLRELRTSSGLTGRQLAESLSWPASKISKLENGRQTPTDEDILAWTATTGSATAADALLTALHNLELQHAEWERLLRSGHEAHQRNLTARDEKTKEYRVFSSSLIPGVMQTADYARAVFARATALHHVPNDVNEAVRARMQRQEMLYRPDKRFYFVLSEAALRYRMTSVDIMLAQMDRLISLSALRTVRLGILGFDRPLSILPHHGFWLLDNDLVRVETFTAELNLKQPQEIEKYGEAFEALARSASYGAAARAVIMKVIDELSAELPDDDTAV